MDTPADLPSLLRVLGRQMLGIAVFIGMGIVALMVLTVTSNFFPIERKELTNPAGKPNRAFIEFLWPFTGPALQVSDWPETWSGPLPMGLLEWPEKYVSREIHWSVDGTVIAFRSQIAGAASPAFTHAYDYRDHVGMGVVNAKNYGESRSIESLMEERGGIGPAIDRAECLRNDNLAGFPLWGWIAPGALVVLGGWLGWRVGKIKEQGHCLMNQE